MFDETFSISMKTLENLIFPTSIKSSLLPRPDHFESSLLPRLVCFAVTKMVSPFMTTINNINSLLHRLRECITK